MRLEDAHAGVDVDERLVLVVPHRVQDDLLPVLERELRRLSGELEISLLAIAAAQPVPALPTRAGGTLEELLERAEAPPELWERRTRAHGSFTLEIRAHDRLEAYAELVDALERGMWSVASAINEAKDGR